jgi:hypothetical protein
MMRLKKKKQEKKRLQGLVLVNETLALKSYFISPGFSITVAWIMYD